MNSTQNKIDIYESVIKLFQTRAAIRVSKQNVFIGQMDHIIKILDGISEEGSAISIIGERGIGKTSLGWQILEVIRGNKELLNSNKITLPFNIKEYYCAWIECTKSMSNINDLLISLLSEPRIIDKETGLKEETLVTLFKQIIEESEAEKLLGDILGEEDLTLLRKYRLDSNYIDNELAVSELDLSVGEALKKQKAVIELFYEIVTKIAQKEDKELVIFIDEFDRLENKEGIGDLIKTINHAKFVIIGVAEDIKQIIDDHESIERKFIGNVTNLDRFKENDIVFFLSRISRLSQKIGLKISYSEEFIKKIVEYCDGFPYMVQLLCLRSFKEHWKNNFENIEKEAVLNEEDFKSALSIFVDEKTDTKKRNKNLSNSLNNVVKKAIVKYMAENRLGGWIKVKEIMDALTRKNKPRQFESNLKELDKDGIIRYSFNRVRFYDSVYRAICKNKIENNEFDFFE